MTRRTTDHADVLAAFANFLDPGTAERLSMLLRSSTVKSLRRLRDELVGLGPFRAGTETRFSTPSEALARIGEDLGPESSEEPLWSVVSEDPELDGRVVTLPQLLSADGSVYATFAVSPHGRAAVYLDEAPAPIVFLMRAKG